MYQPYGGIQGTTGHILLPSKDGHNDNNEKNNMEGGVPSPRADEPNQPMKGDARRKMSTGLFNSLFADHIHNIFNYNQISERCGPFGQINTTMNGRGANIYLHAGNVLIYEDIMGPVKCSIMQYKHNCIRCTLGRIIDTTLSFDTGISVQYYDTIKKVTSRSVMIMIYLSNMILRNLIT